MNQFFKKLKIGCLNDHFDILGGGTVHSFKFIEYLKKFYNIDVYVSGTPKTKEWMQRFLHLDTEGINIYPYTKGCGNKYDYMFLNISHWRAEETKALKKYMLVFFPQFYFPLYDYEFLANSKYTKDNIIKRWKQTPERIHVVYPPIMTSQFIPSDNKEKNIIHVSRITPPVPEADKGHRQMIQAFKEMVDAGLKDWTFHIIGQVQDQIYFGELYRIAHGYPIKFHVDIPFEKLKELYSKSMIYWHMTGISMPDQVGAQEHFGMTTVEAMASGCVPVVLNTGGQPEIVVNGDSGFLVKDCEELKEKTFQLIRNKQLYETLQIAAIHRAKIKFDEEVSEKKLLSVITHTDKVSIIMLCWNNSQYTKDCVNRLYEVTPPGFELILVDNNSKDDTWSVIQSLQKKYPNIKAIHNNNNLGFALGNNNAQKIAKGDYICYLNNDTLPQWGWLERMVDVLEKNPKVGIVGARLYFNQDDKGIWKIQHAGVTFRNGEIEHIGRFQTDKEVRGMGCEEIESVTGACMLVRKELAGFDAKYVRGYYEDIDLCLTVRQKGYKVVLNHEAKLIHYEGKSQDIAKKKDNKRFCEITEKNKKLFEEKWHITKIKNLPKISMTPDLSGITHEEKIEIGGGERPLHNDYAQVDLRKLPHVKYINDARLLSFPSNTLTDICSSYMICCLKKEEAEAALKEWHRCLKPGGKLELYIPDLSKITKELIATRNEDLLKEIYGEQKHELDFYQWGYTFETMDALLSKVNFVRIMKTSPSSMHPNSLGIIAYKPL